MLTEVRSNGANAVPDAPAATLLVPPAWPLVSHN